MTYYRHVARGEVSQNVITAAEEALARASSDLGLRHISIVWFRKTEDAKAADFAEQEPICGQARGLERDRVWINADLNPAEASRTALHESKHLQQFVIGTAPIVGGAPGRRIEAEARLYETGIADHEVHQVLTLADRFREDLKSWERL